MVDIKFVNAVNTMKKAKLFSGSPVLLAQGNSHQIHELNTKNEKKEYSQGVALMKKGKRPSIE